MSLRAFSLAMLLLATGCTSVSGPGSAARLVRAPNQAIPTTPPDSSVQPAAVAWPEAHVLRLANGVTLVTVPMAGESRVVVLARMLGAGEAGSPDTTGLPSIALAMLRRGSRTAAGAIEWPIGQLGGEGMYSFTTESVQIRVRGESGDVSMFIAAIGRELRAPAFDAQWLEIERQDFLDTARRMQTPHARGRLAMGQALFGSTSPLARSTPGEEAFIRSLDSARLARFHSEFYIPQRTIVVVAGGFDERVVREATTSAFADWSSGPATPAVAFDAPFAPAPAPFSVIDDQRDHALIHFAVPFELSTMEDRAAFRVLSLLYGGVFDSWLNFPLREEEGASYSVRAFPFGAYHRGALLVELIVGLENVERVVTTLRHAAVRLARGAVTEEELSLARAQLTSRFLATFSDPESTAAVAADALTRGTSTFEGLASEHAWTLAAPAESFASAAPRIFRPERATMIVTGPASTIGARARAAWDAPIP